MKLKRKELKEKSLQEVLNHLLENDYNFEMIAEKYKKMEVIK